MKSQNSLAFIGDLTVDRYSGSKQLHLGGASLNGAIWAQRSGVQKVSVFAAIGTDQPGRLFQKIMSKEGINADAVTVISGVTSSIDIIRENNGDHRWGTWNAGVLANYHLGGRELKRLQTYTAASLTVYGKTKHLLTEFGSGWRTRKNSPFLAVNFDDLSQLESSIHHVEDTIGTIDAGFFGLQYKNDNNLLSDLKNLANVSGKLMVITLGKYGAVAFSGNKSYESEAVRVRPEDIKDTTGAGDAFLAGFLSEYLKERNIACALRAGNNLAARKIQLFGAY